MSLTCKLTELNHKKEHIMASFKFKGSDLYTSSHHKIASINGTGIYDEHLHKVATIKGSDIYDEHLHKVATVIGTDIYDEHKRRIATMNDVKRSIDGATGGTSIVGLWLFFVR
jgi:hypothetical protein